MVCGICLSVRVCWFDWFVSEVGCVYWLYWDWFVWGCVFDIVVVMWMGLLCFFLCVCWVWVCARLVMLWFWGVCGGCWVEGCVVLWWVCECGLCLSDVVVWECWVCCVCICSISVWLLVLSIVVWVLILVGGVILLWLCGFCLWVCCGFENCGWVMVWWFVCGTEWCV